MSNRACHIHLPQQPRFAIDDRQYELLSALLDNGASFMVEGAAAAAYYGSEAAVFGLELWVEPSARNAQSVFRGLASIGVLLRHHESAQLEFQAQAMPVPAYSAHIRSSTHGLSFARALAHSSEVLLQDRIYRVLALEDLKATANHEDFQCWFPETPA